MVDHNKNYIVRQCSKIRSIILDLFFPKRCVGCRAFGSFLCPECLAQIVLIKSPFCPGCRRLTPVGQYCRTCRSRDDVYLSGVIIAAHYEEGPVRSAIHEFKYKKVRALVSDLASILIKRLELGFPAGDLVIIPVPLHRTRERWRGFNQATELAAELGEAFDIPVEKKILIRQRETKPQIELTRLEREKNIKGAFTLQKKADFATIQKKTILLVDDVMTSGFTLNECAKVLRSIGCRRIWGLVLAKG